MKFVDVLVIDCLEKFRPCCHYSVLYEISSKSNGNSRNGVAGVMSLIKYKNGMAGVMCLIKYKNRMRKTETCMKTGLKDL